MTRRRDPGTGVIVWLVISLALILLALLAGLTLGLLRVTS